MLLKNIFSHFIHQRGFFHSSFIFSSKAINRMCEKTVQKAIIIQGSDKSRVSIKFKFNVGNKVRTFNMNRQVNEELSSVMVRMKVNISSKMNAKQKKRKNKDQEEIEPDNTIDDFIVRLLKSSTSMCYVHTTDALDTSTLTEVDGNSSCLDAFVTDGTKHILQLGSLFYTLDINPPKVDAMSLPSNIMAGFLLYPNYLDLSNAVFEHSKTQWFISKEVFEEYQLAQGKLNTMIWQELNTGFLLTTTDDMVGKLLKVVVEPRDGSRCGESSEGVARSLVRPRPPQRPYQDRHKHTTAGTEFDCARVVSYNLLADTYASTTFSAEMLFASCPGYALDGFYRKQLLIDEVLGYHGDIVCLQEVDEDLFKYDLQRVLPLQSPLRGCYAGKCSDSTKEGSATFYNSDKFRLLESSNLPVCQELMSLPSLSKVWESVQRNPQLEESVITRTTVLQVCVLERILPANMKENHEDQTLEVIVVENTHFYFHPDADHIRILQSIVALAVLENTVQHWQQKGYRVSVLFCGDLNSTPDTGVYQLATTGSVEDTHRGWAGVPGDEKVKGVCFQHSIPLKSACGTPRYTNYVAAFNGCLDWIFYQTDRFTIQKTVPLPSHEVVTAHTALPSPVIPSDHLALVADLRFND